MRRVRFFLYTVMIILLHVAYTIFALKQSKNSRFDDHDFQLVSSRARFFGKLRQIWCIRKMKLRAQKWSLCDRREVDAFKASRWARARFNVTRSGQQCVTAKNTRFLSLSPLCPLYGPFMTFRRLLAPSPPLGEKRTRRSTADCDDSVDEIELLKLLVEPAIRIREDIAKLGEAPPREIDYPLDGRKKGRKKTRGFKVARFWS